jgi:hypothetical protein
MLQTKHLATLSGLLFLFAFVIMGTMFGTQEGQVFVMDSNLQLAGPQKSMEVVIATNDSRERARTSLLERLQGGAGIREKAEKESHSNTIEILEKPSRGAPETIMDENGIELGDGQFSSKPEKGAVFACAPQTSGSAVALPWVQNERWYPEKRLSVDGSVFWQPMVTITQAEGARVITGNGLPAHSTGFFPVSPQDDAYPYKGSESAIVPQSNMLQLPQNPVTAPFPSCVGEGQIGVALNGVALYSALGPGGEDLGARSVLDRCGGSTSASGEYHYYGESDCLFDAYYEGAESTLLGYAIDGFGIFAGLENGAQLTNDDLDACHGHTHELPWDGQLVSMYHYHMTEEYPYTVGCFMGPSTPQ